MTVRVDEARSHDAVGDIQDGRHPRPDDVTEVANGDDPIVVHADVRASTGSAQAVDDDSAPEQQVERRHSIDGAMSTSPKRPPRASTCRAAVIILRAMEGR